MAATLTERYISAVTKSLDPPAQDDVRAELEASISDAVEARVEQGESSADAERSVLTDLGDPAILAAGYADRPLHLIGPRYYLTWWRLLKVLLWIIPVTGFIGVTIAKVIADQPVGEVIGSAISVGLGAVVHVAFWTTVVFFILERTGSDTGVRWTIDSLPELQQDGAGRSDLIASLVFLGLAAAALLWDRFIGFVFVADGAVDTAAGLGSQTSAMPILHPDLWPWWIAGLLVLIAAEAALAIVVYAGHGWRTSLAALNTLLAVVFASAAIYLLVSGQLINPAFVEFAFPGGNAVDDAVRVLGILLIVGITGWDVVDSWRKAHRARLRL